jgi:glycosyltransferase involved in cell wall biosynthesis
MRSGVPWWGGTVKPCVLIPIYNHPDTIGDVVSALGAFDVPCLVVDDGSDAATRRVLARLAEDHPWVTVERLPANRGRGAALRHGYSSAARRGFSHVIQLDADGQHDPADVPRFLAAALERPEAAVLGAPVFDASTPWSRWLGRQISRFWVHVETLSFSIRDPLCGYRCLPLEAITGVLARRPLGDRMEFDPQIVVCLAWEGVPIVNVPTHVTYRAGGVSHFRLVRDNALISRAHAGLVFGMLRRLPALLARRRSGRR